MQTVTLKIDDSFYHHFIELIKNISHDRVKIVDSGFPQELIVSSVEEVRQRVYKAEKSKGLTLEEYEKEMDKFFLEELGTA